MRRLKHLMQYLPYIQIVSSLISWSNFNYTYPRTICMQYLWILLSSFGKEDFKALWAETKFFAFFYKIFHQLVKVF